MINNKLITKSVNLEFIAEAVKCKVEFIVIGGTATAFYGCRNIHEVDDLDLLINPTQINSKKIKELFKSLKLQLNHDWNELTKPNMLIPLKEIYYLDILTPPDNGIQFHDIERLCLYSYINNIRVKVISLSKHLEMLYVAILNEQKNPDKIQKLNIDIQCLETKVNGLEF